MSGERVTIDTGLNVQRMYDHARAVEEGYRELAERLAEEYDVCEHPEEFVEEKEMGRGDTLTICASCETLLKRRPNHSEE